MASPRTWSLFHELATIEKAVRGAEILLEDVQEQRLDPVLLLDVVLGAAAAMTVVQLRLRDLGRLLSGDLDPMLLHAHHNALPAEDATVNHGKDVIFAPRPEAQKPPARNIRRSRRR